MKYQSCESLGITEHLPSRRESEHCTREKNLILIVALGRTMQSKTAIGSFSTAELSILLVLFLGKGNQEIIVILPAILLICSG